MLRFLQFISNERPILTIRNVPPQLLTETSQILEEGQWKNWPNGFESRLDRRPSNMGGDQLHVRNHQGQWAFRASGKRSEPNKYKLRTTNKVKDIVQAVFGIDRSLIESIDVTEVNDEAVIVEVRLRDLLKVL